MRYSIFAKEGQNLDVLVLRIELAHEENEVLKVNRLMDYLLVRSNHPETLWVEGVFEVSEDKDYSGLHSLS
jgi:hypothetical protein